MFQNLATFSTAMKYRLASPKVVFLASAAESFTRGNAHRARARMPSQFESAAPSIISRRHRFTTCTPSDLGAFERDGFFVARGALDDAEVALVRRALETDATLTENEIILSDASGGATKLALWSEPGDGTLGMLIRSRRVVQTMEQLLGGRVMHYHSKQLLKMPQAGGVWNWHQDYGYWYKDFFLMPQMATAYVAIDPQSEALNNGAIKLLKGSHKMGRLDHWSVGDQQGADLERVALARERFEEHTCDLHPGDILFFSALALHASPGNFSDHRRLALASCFTLADNTQFKNPYIPCADVHVVDDTYLLTSAHPLTGEPTLTSAQDKKMLNPDIGREKARKDDQN